MKFIHIADLHLGSSFLSSSLEKNIAKERREELFKAFNRIISSCKKRKVDMLLIAGDLFEDEWVRASDVKRVIDGFNEIPDIKVLIVAGNHDYMYEKSFYNLLQFPDNVTIFNDDKLEKVEFEDLNTCVYGLSFMEKHYKESKFELPELDSDKNNILLLHCDVTDGESNYMPVTKSMLENSGFDYCAIGHIHKAQKVCKNAIYPGSLEPLDFSEKGVHGYVYGELEKHSLSVKLIRSSKKQFVSIDVDISGMESLKDIVEMVKEKAGEEIKDNLYRVSFYGAKSDLISMEDVITLLNWEFNYVEIKDSTVNDFHIGKIYTESKNNIIGQYIDALKNKEGALYTDALYLGLEALLNEEGN